MEPEQQNTQPNVASAQPVAPVQPVATQQAAPSSNIITDSKGSSQSRKKLFIFGGIAALIVIAAVVAYFVMSRGNQTAYAPQNTVAKVLPSPTIASKPTPSITPITASNVNQTLTDTSNKVDQAVNQANADLQSISNIDQSQDSTAGL